MAEMKLLFFANILGYTIAGIAPFVVDNWQRYIIFALAVLFFVQKMYFNFRKNQQDVKNRDLSLRKKEHDVAKEMEE